MEQIGRNLLKQFVYMDEKLNLFAADGSFEIPLSITAAKLFSPVLKAALESPLAAITNNEEREDKRDDRAVTKKVKHNVYSSGSLRRVEVKGFNTQTVQCFIRSLQGQLDDQEVKTFNWKQSISLLKMFHFYDVENMYETVLQHATSLIQQNNVVEAVEYMETFGFIKQWCDKIVTNLQNFKAILQTQDWKDSILKYPVTQSQVQSRFLQVLGYG